MRHPTKAQVAWTKGFFDAYVKGKAAAEDPAFDESHNPYKRYEHRRQWRDGFLAKRKEIADGKA